MVTELRSNGQAKEPAPNFSKEISAALVLLMIALPLNIGVALASGVNAEQGIISGIIGAIITGGLSACAVQVSGPDAGIGVLVLEMIKDHGLGNLGIIVFLAGLIQLLLGVTKSAKWFRAVSPAVVNGMLAGMGLLIIFTQFHIMLDDKPKDNGLLNLFYIPEAIMKGIVPSESTAHHIAALIGIGTIIVSCLWTKLAAKRFPNIPNALVAILVASFATALLDLPVQMVALPASLTSSIQLLSPEDIIHKIANKDIWMSAFTLFFVISAQSLITLAGIETITQKRATSYDRELTAQGVGNILCGLLGTLPIAGVLLRSMATVQAGAITKLPNIGHGVLMLLTVLTIPGLLQKIPTSALAALLVLIGYRMVMGIWSTVRNYERSELIVFAITSIAIIATNLFTGVLIGFVVAAAKVLNAIAKLNIVIEYGPGPHPKFAVLHFHGAATFLQLPKLTETLESIPEDIELHIRLDEINYIDHGFLDHLVKWEQHHQGSLVIDWGDRGPRFRGDHRAPEESFNGTHHGQDREMMSQPNVPLSGIKTEITIKH